MKMPNKQYIIFNKKIPYNDITVIHISWCISHIIHFMYETLLPRRPPPPPPPPWALVKINKRRKKLPGIGCEFAKLRTPHDWILCLSPVIH